MPETIFVVAPPNTTWPLDLAGFEHALRTRWPEVRTDARQAPATKHDYLAFELDLAGERRHGAYFDHGNLALEDGTPTFWADTVAWFLSLLPTDASVLCMTESAPNPTPLTRQSDPAQIVTVLDSLGG